MHLIRISREQIDAIKARIDFAALVAERGIELERRGGTSSRSVPSIRSETPSFVVTPHRGLFHCFGCGVGGDVIGFVVRYDHVSFPEAVRMLAARAGVDARSSRTRRDARAPASQAAARGEAVCGRTSWRRSRPACRGASLSGRRALPPDLLRAEGRSGVPRASAASRTSDLLKAFKVGYADGSLLKVVPKDGELREQLLSLGVITKEGRELLGRLRRRPDPRPDDGRVDDPLRPRACARRGTATCPALFAASSTTRPRAVLVAR